MSTPSDRRPYRELCPRADERDAMTDSEFWDDVMANLGHPQDGREPDPEDEQPDPPAVTAYDTPCAVCGTTGPCAFDANGLPLIHADEEVVVP